MEGEPRLFDIAGPAWRHTDPDTSVEAGKIAVGRSKIRKRILVIHGQNRTGLTDCELANLMPDAHRGSVAKRRHDLTVAGLIEHTDERRDTDHSCQAIVWVITVAGTNALRDITE